MIKKSLVSFFTFFLYENNFFLSSKRISQVQARIIVLTDKMKKMFPCFYFVFFNQIQIKHSADVRCDLKIV